ncbi:hypothetical protein ACFL6N_04740 [Thermodesulfobacteriota bacterium]
MKEPHDMSMHTFHIPVMGTGFTIDTPLRVARYGISSVVSLVDDVLIEQMREYHCRLTQEPYEKISSQQQDARALRITAYLNLLNCLLDRQAKDLQNSPFEPGSEITRYYEMLPDEAPVKKLYHDMIHSTDDDHKQEIMDLLRKSAVPGSIDVNIMTKLDRINFYKGKELGPEFSDAMAALRGFAQSNVRSSIIFSAGINKRLYKYLAKFDDFYPDKNGVTKKNIILKVSDFRSAEIQGRFLARMGLWVSEYRIESGLNCGGHAFGGKGILMGPILAEFKQNKKTLAEKLHEIRNAALAKQNRPGAETFPPLRITTQGGIGTAMENRLLLKYYEVDSTGWGTPFLLVPEAINIDDDHLKKLTTASKEDVFLSDSSPLSTPFWNLRTSASEQMREQRIRDNKPGSPCPKAFAVTNTEFTKRQICLSSRAYQKKKLAHLPEENHTQEQLPIITKNILAKSCICHDLGGNATLKLGIDPKATPCVCCGPNIIHFSKIATLEQMVDHIYGRMSLLTNSERPHMFINELSLSVDNLCKELEKFSLGLLSSTPKYLQETKENLLKGIEYYQNHAAQLVSDKCDRFLTELIKIRETVETLPLTEIFDEKPSGI